MARDEIETSYVWGRDHRGLLHPLRLVVGSDGYIVCPTVPEGRISKCYRVETPDGPLCWWPVQDCAVQLGDALAVWGRSSPEMESALDFGMRVGAGPGGWSDMIDRDTSSKLSDHQCRTNARDLVTAKLAFAWLRDRAYARFERLPVVQSGLSRTENPHLKRISSPPEPDPVEFRRFH